MLQLEEAKKLIEKARSINPNVKIVAATKTRTADDINKLLNVGITAMGENRVQELLEKYDGIKLKEIHFIGALQTNKVKYIVDKVSMIESLDRTDLADEIEKRCAKIDKTMDVLIEVNVGAEESKSGCEPEKLFQLYQYVSNLKHLRVRGLMSVLPIGAPEQLYSKMYDLFLKLKSVCDSADYLSMGMSDDYEIALKCGANLIRPGTALFGQRIYQGVN